MMDSWTTPIDSKARVKQPKPPPTLWTNTSLEPGRSFESEAKGQGSKMVDGTSRSLRATKATLGIGQRGFFLPILAMFLAG